MFHEVTVSGERILPLPMAALVASKSHPGTWHLVKNQACDCAGFGYRGICRHVRAVTAFILQGEDPAEMSYPEWLESRKA